MKLFWRLLMTGLVAAGLFWTAAVVAYELTYSPTQRATMFKHFWD